MLKKIRDRVAATLNFGDRFSKFVLAKKDRGLSARVHHEDVRPELLEVPRKLFVIRVLGDKSEKIEIALSVTHDACEIVDLKQTQITMIILDPFLL